jgi:hypothetical protein
MLIIVLFSLTGLPALAQDAAEETDVAEDANPAEEAAQADTDAEEQNGNGIDSPKTMSGMSILGNEEAPKSLVIVPWKSSQMGDEMNLSDTLDDRARPVDKEVFERELRFYEIRAGGET